MLARVLDNGDYYDAFPVTNGVKQDCVLAPTLFSMIFTAMLTNAFDNDDGNVISTRYETNGKLSNLRRLQAKTKVKQAAARDLLFADDCALNTSTETMMQQSVGRFSTVCDNFGFIISTKKTKVMHQPAPQKMYEPPTITVKDETLEAVDEFTYLETHSQDL